MTDSENNFNPDRFPGLLRIKKPENGNHMAVFEVPQLYVRTLLGFREDAVYVVCPLPVRDMEQAHAVLTASAQEIGLPDAPDAAAPRVPSTISVDALAEWICMTPRNVQILESKGIVHKDGRGSYKLKESVQGYIREINRQGDGKNSDYNRERTEAMRLKRQERELEYLERAGKLVNADHARKMIEKVFGVMRQNILMMPKFLAPRLDGLTAQEQEVILEDYVRQCLNQLAAPDISGVIDSGSVPDNGPAAEAPVVRVGKHKKGARKQGKR